MIELRPNQGNLLAQKSSSLSNIKASSTLENILLKKIERFTSANGAPSVVCEYLQLPTPKQPEQDRGIQKYLSMANFQSGS